MKTTELNDLEKRVRISELYPALMSYPNLMKYFDLKSTRLLDKKIAVLESLSSGKSIAEIPGFYEIFELLPEDDLWD